ncbi:hypothetical protein HDU93_003291 [Gonapodya sp. JEL0774]|nr:hypothetical protein HDU93_003291 [Gonapodya sp. JEL0774]
MFSTKKKSAPTSAPLLPEFSRGSLFGTARTPSVISLPPPVAVLRAATTPGDLPTEISEPRVNGPQKSSPDGTSQWTEEMRSKISTPFGFRQELHVNKDLTWSSEADPRSLFTFEEKLGSGAFGSVWKAKLSSSGVALAIKEIPVELESDRVTIRKEIETLKQASHPNLVQYYGCLDVPAEQAVWGNMGSAINVRLFRFPIYVLKPHIATRSCQILMEYCSGGSCSDLMSVLSRPLTDLEASTVISDALRGLSYLHSKGIVHHDIKAANILLDGAGVAKIADFGVSETLTGTLAQSKSKVVGSPYWMAPEILVGNTYSASVDVWAIGVTAIELLTGRPPHYDQHPMRAMYKIPFVDAPRLPGPDDDGNKQQSGGAVYSEGAREFVERCLQKKPNERPKTSEAEALGWIKEARARGGEVELVVATGRKRTTSNGSLLNGVADAEYPSGTILPPLSSSGSGRVGLLQLVRAAEIARKAQKAIKVRAGTVLSSTSGLTAADETGADSKGHVTEVKHNGRRSSSREGSFNEDSSGTVIYHNGSVAPGTLVIHEDDRSQTNTNSKRLTRIATGRGIKDSKYDGGSESEAESEDAPFAAESDSEQVVIRASSKGSGAVSPTVEGRKAKRVNSFLEEDRWNYDVGSGTGNLSPGPGTPVSRSPRFARTTLPATGLSPTPAARVPRRQPSAVELLQHASGELERAAAVVTASLTELGQAVGPKITELGEAVGPVLNELAHTANARIVEFGEAVNPKITELKDFVAPRLEKLLAGSVDAAVRLSEAASSKFNQLVDSLPPDVAKVVRLIVGHIRHALAVLSHMLLQLLALVRHYVRVITAAVAPYLHESRGVEVLTIARDYITVRARIMSQSKWFRTLCQALLDFLVWSDDALTSGGVLLYEGGKVVLRGADLASRWTVEEVTAAAADPPIYAKGLTRRVPRAAGQAAAAIARRTWGALAASPFETHAFYALAVCITYRSLRSPKPNYESRSLNWFMTGALAGGIVVLNRNRITDYSRMQIAKLNYAWERHQRESEEQTAGGSRLPVVAGRRKM